MQTCQLICQHRELFWKTPWFEPRAAGSGSKYANHCAMLPPFCYNFIGKFYFTSASNKQYIFPFWQYSIYEQDELHKRMIGNRKQGSWSMALIYNIVSIKMLCILWEFKQRLCRICSVWTNAALKPLLIWYLII